MPDASPDPNAAPVAVESSPTPPDQDQPTPTDPPSTADNPSLPIPFENRHSEIENPPLSPQKLSANRANALNSTGPRSPDGKARSAMNALTHGLRARLDPAALVSETERDDYAHFLTHLRQTLDPADPLEDLLVERIALLAWQLRRNAAAQACLLDLTRQRQRKNLELENKKLLDAHQTHLSYMPPARRQKVPPPELKPIPQTEPAPQTLAHIVETYDRPLTTLHRYASATERAFYKALNQYRLLHAPPQPDLHHHFHYHRHDSPTTLITQDSSLHPLPLPPGEPPLKCAKLPNEPTEV